MLEFVLCGFQGDEPMRSMALAGCLALLCSFNSPGLRAQSVPGDQHPPSSSIDQLPLSFEPNWGQTDSRISFVSRASTYAVFLEPTKAVVALGPKKHEGAPTAVSMELLGASRTANGSGVDRLPGVSNYFVGHSSARWLTGIPHYAKAEFRSIYPGIDLVYYGSDGELESDFILSPGADPRRIAFRIAGITSMNLSSSGNLLMQVPDGTFELKKPTIYQNIRGTRRLIAGKFTIRNHDQVGLDVGDYDATQALVIDPALSYSTLIGANNGTTAQAAGVDSLGNVYITGTTYATNYPIVTPFQATNNGTTNVFVTKLNAAGNTILYSTYLGGSGFPGASAIAVDGGGNAYVTGIAAMSDFPTTPGAFMTTCPGGFCNAPFVAKFLSTGVLAIPRLWEVATHQLVGLQ
jgi:hypothetical protein